MMHFVFYFCVARRCCFGCLCTVFFATAGAIISVATVTKNAMELPHLDMKQKKDSIMVWKGHQICVLLLNVIYKNLFL